MRVEIVDLQQRTGLTPRQGSLHGTVHFTQDVTPRIPAVIFGKTDRFKRGIKARRIRS